MRSAVRSWAEVISAAWPRTSVRLVQRWLTKRVRMGRSSFGCGTLPQAREIFEKFFVFLPFSAFSVSPTLYCRGMVTAPKNVGLDDVRDIEAFLGVLVGRLDPDAIPLCEAPDMWRSFGAVARLAASAQTLLARRVEEAGEWRRSGHRSAEEKMAADDGTSTSAAKSSLKTSKRVRKLPKTADKMRRGELSPGKAEAIADAAAVAPEAEDELLHDAENTPLLDLRDRCQQAKAKDADATYKRLRRNRYARVFKDAEGAWNLRARGTVDDGARFMTVFQPLIDAHFKAAKKEERIEPIEACAFDALMEMGELAGGTSPDAESSKPRRSPATYRALLRIDYETLVRGAAEGDERCEIAGLGPIPVARARELLGDAILELVITKGVDVANVTHLGRSASSAQQVALWWSARACQRIDCTRTERLQNDHREEWHKVHETRLDNLDPLCPHDHWLKTYEGWALVEGKGRRAFVPPDDSRHPKNKPRR